MMEMHDQEKSLRGSMGWEIWTHKEKKEVGKKGWSGKEGREGRGGLGTKEVVFRICYV